jgi:hypothetical protein
VANDSRIPLRPWRLIDYAGYLLFPNPIPPVPIAGSAPCQVLVPDDRLSLGGTLLHYEAWLAGLATAGSPFPLLHNRPAWKSLVDAVEQWAIQRTAAGTLSNRFGGFPYRTLTHAAAFCVTEHSGRPHHLSKMMYHRHTPLYDGRAYRNPGFWYVRLDVNYIGADRPPDDGPWTSTG